MKITVKILNDKLEAVKEIDGFDSYGWATEFAKNEAEWRGTPVEVCFYDDLGTCYSRIY